MSRLRAKFCGVRGKCKIGYVREKHDGLFFDSDRLDDRTLFFAFLFACLSVVCAFVQEREWHDRGPTYASGCAAT